MHSAFNKSGMVIFLALMLWVSQVINPAKLQASEKNFRNSIGMEFVLIPEGTFMMGSPQDEPHRKPNETRHLVVITKPFYMQSTEVTLGQWRAVMGKRFFGRRKGMEALPVVKVSWYDCMDFVEKINGLHEGVYRLPTEAEWEYACRAGSKEAYAFGKTLSCDLAMFGNSRHKWDECLEKARIRGLPANGPAPVKSFPPNAWGLYDMHGNVWEWCSDWYAPYPDHPVSDPRGPESGKKRVRRGGSWFKYAWYCRSANRNYAHPASLHITLGFRVVRELQ